jgi:hypothetical protein
MSPLYQEYSGRDGRRTAYIQSSLKISGSSPAYIFLKYAAPDRQAIAQATQFSNMRISVSRSRSALQTVGAQEPSVCLRKGSIRGFGRWTRS